MNPTDRWSTDPTSTSTTLEAAVAEQQQGRQRQRQRQGVPIASVPVKDGFIQGASFVTSRPKYKFVEGPNVPDNQKVQETDSRGVPKWSVVVNLLLAANKYGEQKTPQVTMTFTAPTDPTEGFAWNQPVEFDNLQYGVMFPRDGGVVIWLGADAIRPVSAGARPLKAVGES